MNIIDNFVDARVKELLGDFTVNTNTKQEYGLTLPENFSCNEISKTAANNYLKSLNKADEKLNGKAVQDAFAKISFAIDMKAEAIANCIRRFGMKPQEIVNLMTDYTNAKNADKAGVSVEEYIEQQKVLMAEKVAKRNATIASKFAEN